MFFRNPTLKKKKIYGSISQGLLGHFAPCN